MDRSENIDFNSLTTLQLAFNLARGKYNESEKIQVLDVIQSRELKPKDSNQSLSTISDEESLTTNAKTPLKGSKSEKIYKLAMEGKTPKEIFEVLNKKEKTVYFPEVYRVFKKYGIKY